MPRFGLKRLNLFVLFILMTACNSELGATGDSGALSIMSEALPQAFIGEPYNATIRAIRGLTPYTFELSTGDLPPGLELAGGSLVGTPTEEGSFSFTISVTDAKLSKTFADFTLTVSTAPPAELTLNVPTTEVQRTVTLRGDVKNVRNLQAFRALISWDASRFDYVPDSARVSRDNLALFTQEAEGQLYVDIAILGGSLSEDRRVFEFELRPIETSFLELRTEVEFTSANNDHGYATLTEGTPVAEDPTLETQDLPDGSEGQPQEQENPEQDDGLGEDGQT